LFPYSQLYLEINKDEIVAILGPNGAGKSTMINILTCQLSSNEGFAKLGPFFIRNEFTLDSMYVKRIVGVCSQFDYLWEELTVYEHLYLYSKLRGFIQFKS
jgi:ATP-binding cassette subfamily A (ABC1) protein 3